MTEKHCENCQHYMQHFALNKRRIFRVQCGHCTFARPKRKRPDAKACEHYTPGRPPEDAFATKEYLSKELLQYVLGLELLPAIETENEGFD